MKLLSSSSRGRACGKAGAGRQPRQQALSLQGRPSLALSRTTSSSQLCSSHNGRLELALGGTAATDVQAAAADAAGGLEQQAYDVIGLAQAMVDLSAAVDDGLLAQLGVERGSRRLIGVEERAEVLARLEGRETAISAGGSLSNTLLALARLSAAGVARWGGAPLRVGMAGLVGSDPLGGFFTAQMRQAGVDVVSPPLAGAATGTVVVLTAQDASRTMLSYLGTPAEVEVDAALEAAIARSRCLVVEGYLWELPGAERTITKAIAAARRAGCVVAMTAGDAGVVSRHHAELWRAIDQGIDLLFTNASEAAELLRYEPPSAAQRQGLAAAASHLHCATGEQLALRLAPHCSAVVVTDGAAGSYIAALGEIHCQPPVWMESPPVDTCGAGERSAAADGWIWPEAAAALVEGLPAPQSSGGLRQVPSSAALAPSTPHAVG
ncbi:hypothetical protein COHA_006084 [Chlorella ohadii]|uniref:Carbohydrate kinase PfkB domain-containing protein n=1 Tax=Chlorella ohadii TaxID=2649997 RepID=A0AAD5DLS7_9CHLO|nr:hypothetical protein COHA_006084 [Chlorella ohadii]